jgi:hypothetical protein
MPSGLADLPTEKEKRDLWQDQCLTQAALARRLARKDPDR